jgi:hypothetical protein
MGAYKIYTTNTQGIMIFLVGAQAPNSINMHPPLIAKWSLEFTNAVVFPD